MFSNVSTDRTARAICDAVKRLLSKYGESVKAKLIMQTYDGAAVMSAHLNDVQTLVRQDYAFAFFFHCGAHRLNLVLCQSALNIKEVKLGGNISPVLSLLSLRDFLKNDHCNDTAFETCYAAAENRVGVPFRRSEQIINYKLLYCEVIDTIVGMVNNRFQDDDSFSFLDLLKVNPKIFTKWQSGVPADKLQLLREKYGPLFDISSLESQLMFIYKDHSF
ncbi:Hypothetical predicted protein [Paramuricea clavata]|uniref:Uncharacterized protein n=1 Tax=Paramuricea clavata TaxID=317549 RepID=A0A7D9ID68_PARCT|nr:Hypothetical predicted protein [Paramuricea clavata]